MRSPDALFTALGTSIDGDLLVLALTHRSFAHESGGLPTNERLEFLGDAVLGVIVTDYLFHKYRDLSEADLSQLRSGVVSQESLANIARGIDLGGYMLLGRGELKTGGPERDSILSDTMEAIIGAVYLSHGLEATRALVLRLIGGQLTRVLGGKQGADWRTLLQVRATELALGEPAYDVEGAGPDHARTFTATVTVGAVRACASGPSKRVAQREASRLALAQLDADA